MKYIFCSFEFTLPLFKIFSKKIEDYGMYADSSLNSFESQGLVVLESFCSADRSVVLIQWFRFFLVLSI